LPCFALPFFLLRFFISIAGIDDMNQKLILCSGFLSSNCPTPSNANRLNWSIDAWRNILRMVFLFSGLYVV
jgi:hypothetical protein